MQACFSSSTPPLMSISKFISDHPCLTMLETKCTTMTDLKKLHAQLIKTGLIRDKIAASRVLSFSATSPSPDLNYAYLSFTRIENRNLFIWNTIIRAFSSSSTPQIAISLFVDMLLDSSAEPGRLTYPSVFKAYARLGLPQSGAQLHGRVIKLGLEDDTFTKNTVIHMYATSGLLEEARKLFDECETLDVVAWNSMIMGYAKSGNVEDSLRLFDVMPSRNAVSWNTMLSCFVRNGRLEESLELFREFQGVASEFALVSVLNACGRLGALRQGEWIHNYIVRNNVECNGIVTTAIIDMYAKCGEIERAWRVYDSAPRKSLSCWNAMILGLATNGLEREAVELFSRLESSRLTPDEVSFLAVLTACNHSGLVEEAKDFFQCMSQVYNIEPEIRHYGCLVDTLARAGRVEEAEDVVNAMPMQPDAIIHGSLLSACKNGGNSLDAAKSAAESLIALDAYDTSGYVLMCNAYAASGEFEEAAKQRVLMKELQMKKQPGCSSIEINGVVHEFFSGGNF